MSCPGPGCRQSKYSRRQFSTPTQAGAGGQNRPSRPLLAYRKVQRGFGRSALLIFTPPHAGGGCNTNSHTAFGTIVTTTMTPYSPQAPQGQDRRRQHVCGPAFLQHFLPASRSSALIHGLAEFEKVKKILRPGGERFAPRQVFRSAGNCAAHSQSLLCFPANHLLIVCCSESGSFSGASSSCMAASVFSNGS